jgi:replication-associated recombination protein RarA
MLDTPHYDPNKPKTISDLVGNTDIWSSLYAQIREQKAGHLVCIGPAGSGKSLFFKLALDGYKTFFIDCTANSGLRDLRDPIRTFSRGSKMGAELRWMVFEHADALSSDSQAFLRRCLETSSNTTRVAFLCRDAGAMAEPILSRTTLITVAAPEQTEIIFEINRRTNFSLKLPTAENIALRSYGNVRTALLEALATKHCALVTNDTLIPALLSARPTGNDSAAWIQWAIATETTCRSQGIDLRDILRRGWPTHPAVSMACAAWSRLGGTSPRSLFFTCVAAVKA